MADKDHPFLLQLKVIKHYCMAFLYLERLYNTVQVILNYQSNQLVVRDRIYTFIAYPPCKRRLWCMDGNAAADMTCRHEENSKKYIGYTSSTRMLDMNTTSR